MALAAWAGSEPHHHRRRKWGGWIKWSKPFSRDRSRNQDDLQTAKNQQPRVRSSNVTFNPWKSSDQEAQKGTVKWSSTLFADQKTWSGSQTLLQATYKWLPHSHRRRKPRGGHVPPSFHKLLYKLLTTLYLASNSAPPPIQKVFPTPLYPLQECWMTMLHAYEWPWLKVTSLTCVR